MAKECQKYAWLSSVYNKELIEDLVHDVHESFVADRMEGQQFFIINQAENCIRRWGTLRLFIIFHLDYPCFNFISLCDRFPNFLDGFCNIGALIRP